MIYLTIDKAIINWYTMYRIKMHPTTMYYAKWR